MFTVYLSHPFTGNEKQNRKEARNIAKLIVQYDSDIVVINPLDNFKYTVKAEMSYDDIIQHALELMRRADALVLTGDWMESKGCMQEYTLAKNWGMLIFEEMKELLSYMLKREDGSLKGYSEKKE